MFALRNIEARSLMFWKKSVRITYSEYVFVALVIQHAECMRRIMSPVACPSLPYFSHIIS
jgi:hypothetical protein